MTSLNDVADFFSGGTPKKGVAKFWGGDIPWFSAANMRNRFLSTSDVNITQDGLASGSRLAPKGATLLLVRGSGLFNSIPICFADSPVAFNQDVKAICAKPGTDPVYLHFVIEALRPRLEENISLTGIGAGKFDLDFLKRLPFPMISLEDQRELGPLVEAFDRKIDLNRRTNETLEAMARALFKDWFVDFGPTRAKMEGREPYLAPNLWSLFPDRLNEETGLPEGWKRNPLDQFFSVIGGGTPKTSIPHFWNGSIPWFSVTDTPPAGCVFVVDTEKTITEAGLNGSSAQIIDQGRTIISARGTVGNLAIAGRKMTFNQSCYGLEGLGLVGNYTVYLIAQNMVKQLQAVAHGSVFSTITRQTFASLSMPKPDDDVFVAFEGCVSPLFDKILANVLEASTLAQTRNLLLPRLISGEIRLRATEQIARETL